MCSSKPLTFMNLSGYAVSGLRQFYQVEVADLLVVVDDVNSAIGPAAVRGASGSAGGHNGFKSLSSTWDRPVPRGCGSAWARRRRRDLADHVLARFDPDERPVDTEAIGAGGRRVGGVRPRRDRGRDEQVQCDGPKELVGDPTTRRTVNRRAPPESRRAPKLAPLPLARGHPLPPRSAECHQSRRSRHECARQYGLYIIRPDAPEEQVADLTRRSSRSSRSWAARSKKSENWGRRKLAYEIQHHRKATSSRSSVGGGGSDEGSTGG